MNQTALLVIGGRSGVGKSSVAHALHARLCADGVQHAVIEGDYLGLAWPDPAAHHLGARNLQAVWANYRELGYRRLVYTNTVSVLEADGLAQAMGGADVVTRVLLTCDDPTADERLAARERGAELDRHRRRSARAARLLDAEAPDSTVRIATDGTPVERTAARIRALLAW